MTTDEKYMRRCIELARLGLGSTYPNPMVGCVIVHNNVVVGEGYHKKSGEAHAEVNAINSVKNQDQFSNCTLYVSLEPCSHYGKTPPCSDLIISKKIPRVVIGSVDPYVKVAGKGIERLKMAGVNVNVGILKKDCDNLNKRFFTFHIKKRPYIILKWAQTRDGFIDVKRDQDNYGKPTWITNELSRQMVHKLRAEEMAILVGTKTVLKDNPSLTVRDWTGENPIRIVLDRNLSIPNTMNVFNSSAKSIVFNTLRSFEKNNLVYVKVNFKKNLPQQILNYLYVNDIQSLIIEGGAQTLQSFIDQGLWDEAQMYMGSVTFGEGINAPKLATESVSTKHLDDCQLHTFVNKDSINAPSVEH